MLSRGCAGILIASFLFQGCASSRTQRESSVDRPIAITNVVIIDVRSGVGRGPVTVVVSGNIIAAAGPAVTLPKNANAIDGTGKFIIPGLWDMHAHHQATGAESAELFVANGVVGTRDMGADLEFILPLRDKIKRGELLGPEILAAGPILDDRPADWPFRRRVTTADEARRAVRDLRTAGVDFIKVHDSTPRAVFFAIAEETSKLGLTFAGHIPFNVTVEEAANSGMKSIEHLANYRVFNDCSGQPPHGKISCDDLFRKFASNRVWQTPTITFMRDIPDLFTDKPMPHGEYASDSLLALRRKNVEVSKLSPGSLDAMRRQSELSLTAIFELMALGNRFLAGSDGLVPGFSLHDEMEAFTQAGFTSLQALQTATLNPAIFLGREMTAGTVEAGKRADLLLLEANPLDDIRNTRRIAAVLSQGRFLTAGEIRKIKEKHRRKNETTAATHLDSQSRKPLRLLSRVNCCCPGANR